jgi:hypothetical protein
MQLGGPAELSGLAKLSLAHRRGVCVSRSETSRGADWYVPGRPASVGTGLRGRPRGGIFGACLVGRWVEPGRHVRRIAGHVRYGHIAAHVNVRAMATERRVSSVACRLWDRCI